MLSILGLIKFSIIFFLAALYPYWLRTISHFGCLYPKIVFKGIKMKILLIVFIQ
ncbi:hypothetical protein MuYL_3283 [Mucilaginibacter xinganensis]|uniref:Uncharacterized protein n=1 Tax=Mucilaginibacter xinganensis TaxID=1234841 RepID=A0A223P022_9SPHI|nr:hypothetical protein MuYL_3283 [Mucilaginibacter xinganensis]